MLYGVRLCQDGDVLSEMQEGCGEAVYEEHRGSLSNDLHSRCTSHPNRVCLRACVRSDQVVNAFVPPRPASRFLFHLCHDFFVSISQRRQFNRRAFVESCSTDNRVPPGRVPLLMEKEWRDTRAINADTASECLAAAGRGDDVHSVLVFVH